MELIEEKSVSFEAGKVALGKINDAVEALHWLRVSHQALICNHGVPEVGLGKC